MAGKITLKFCERASEKLKNLINESYIEGEEGLIDWSNPTVTRADSNDKPLQQLCDEHEIVIATDDSCESNKGLPIGTIRVEKSGTIGMLAVNKNYRQHGLGRKLINFAENYVKHDLKLSILRIELVYPKNEKNIFKVFLKKWYLSLGFVIVDERDCYEHPVYGEVFRKLLMTEAVFLSMEKNIH